jgi:hypothetical protein
LEGRTPASTSGTIAFEVGDGTPITDFFDRVIQISDTNQGKETSPGRRPVFPKSSEDSHG